jgi:hypothetical protein
VGVDPKELPLTTSHFAAYEALWRRIQSDGVWVHYNGLATHEGGHFAHDGCGRKKKPEIQITRSFYRMPQDEPTELLNHGQPGNVKDELLILAHEYGHYLSWKGETPSEKWNEYHAAAFHRDGVVKQVGWDAVRAALSEDEKQLISDEEDLAWRLGRRFIPDDLHAEYDEKARRGVHNHRYRLGLDELWPEDGAAR